MNSLLAKFWFALTLTLLTTVLGCSRWSDEWTEKRPPVYKVSGTVLLKGKPIDGAEVVFHSSEPSMTATGRTDANGRFQLTTYDEGDGFIEGTHSVSISKRIWIEKPTRFDTPEEPQKALFPKELLPTKFTNPETSQLQATIANRGKNSFDFTID